MILYQGKIYDDSKQAQLIDGLREDLYKPFEQGRVLDRETVINACDKLCARVMRGDFDSIAKPLIEQFGVSEKQLKEMFYLFSRKGLEYKCEIELCDEEKVIDGKFIRKRYPLGILMHIAAGNVDALPAYSVIEGLLAGNVNILKLPASDSGISVLLLGELIREEPKLAEFIYVFDVPSTETQTLKKLADLSDGVVVWGGDEAVKAARQFVDVTTKIIAWGHKLSFAYACTDATDEMLKGVARNICYTNQVFCSSCQGIYVDTDSREEQLALAKRFFEILLQENERLGKADFGMRAKNSINIYNERLERHVTNNDIFSQDGVSVICTDDSTLTLSYMYRSVWVKRLPHNDIIKTLKPHKNHLQTAGLLCVDNEKRKMLSQTLILAGITRVTNGEDMSRTVCGEAHDGCYALREYSRIAEITE